MRRGRARILKILLPCSYRKRLRILIDNQTSKALKEASQTFRNLVGHPEMLESYGENLWEIFEDSLSGREEFDRDTLYDRCMLYDALGRTFRRLAKLKWHPCYVFSISYGPEPRESPAGAIYG